MPPVIFSPTLPKKLLKSREERRAGGAFYTPRNLARVMSYNIRFDTPIDGENRWDRRRDLVASMILSQKAELGGLQEVRKHQLEDLKSLLPHLSFIGVGREDGMDEGEFIPIFFDKNRFSLSKNGHFWLSEEPHVAGSKSWGTDCTRMAVWALLEDKAVRERILLVNTHLDHFSLEAQVRGSYLIRSHIETLLSTERSRPRVMLLGDFNAVRSAPCFEAFTKSEGFSLRFGRECSWCSPVGPKGTFTGWGKPKRKSDGEEEGTMEIDFIMVDYHTEVWQYSVPTDTFDGRLASDHRPVVAEVILLH